MEKEEKEEKLRRDKGRLKGEEKQIRNRIDQDIKNMKDGSTYRVHRKKHKLH